MILYIAWDRHGLLAKMKSDTSWARIKNVAADKGLTLTFEVIGALALPTVNGLLGLEDVS